MTETKTKIREVFVATFRQPVLNLPQTCACSADSCAFCVLCDCIKLGI